MKALPATDRSRAGHKGSFAVEHHPAGLTTGFPCHFQRFHGEVRRELHGPARWFYCEQVENNGEVRPALYPSRYRSHHRTTTDLARSRRTAVQGSQG